MKQKITDIQIDEQNADRRVLFLDGERFGSVDAGLIAKFGVRVGLEIEGEALQKLDAADEITRAKSYAYECLKEQTYTKGQMAECLEREGFSQNAVDTTLKELEQLGQIRDEKFAQAWVNKRQRSKPKSKKMLRHELIDKGVDKSTADAVLNTIDDDEEAGLALQAAEKQAKRYRSLPLQVARRRLYNFLLRRGFSHGTIQKAVKQVLNQVDDDS
jgi:regulatory protein